jgi:hypothetical protein
MQFVVIRNDDWRTKNAAGRQRASRRKAGGSSLPPTDGALPLMRRLGATSRVGPPVCTSGSKERFLHRKRSERVRLIEMGWTDLLQKDRLADGQTMDVHHQWRRCGSERSCKLATTTTATTATTTRWSCRHPTATGHPVIRRFRLLEICLKWLLCRAQNRCVYVCDVCKKRLKRITF